MWQRVVERQAALRHAATCRWSLMFWENLLPVSCKLILDKAGSSATKYNPNNNTISLARKPQCTSTYFPPRIYQAKFEVVECYSYVFLGRYHILLRRYHILLGRYHILLGSTTFCYVGTTFSEEHVAYNKLPKICGCTFLRNFSIYLPI
jgi:hypothetical protein